MGKKAKNKKNRARSFKPSVRAKNVGTIAKISKKYDSHFKLLDAVNTVIQLFKLVPWVATITAVIAWIVNFASLVGPVITSVVNNIFGIFLTEGVLYYASFIAFTIFSVLYLQARYELTTRIRLAVSYIVGLVITASTTNLSIYFWVFGIAYCCAVIWMPPPKFLERLKEISNKKIF